MERRGFPAALRWGLAELHGARCFYCARPIPAKADVDHFIPWVRYPNDAIENLVLADPGCDNHKRDRVAGAGLLERWCERLRDQQVALVDIAEAAKWQTGRERSVGLTRSVYAHLPGGTPLWGGPGIVEAADETVIAAALAACRYRDVARTPPSVG